MRKRMRHVAILDWICCTPNAMRPPKAPAKTPAPMKAAKRVAISSFLYFACFSLNTPRTHPKGIMQDDSLSENRLANPDEQTAHDDSAKRLTTCHGRGSNGPPDQLMPVFTLPNQTTTAQRYVRRKGLGQQCTRDSNKNIRDVEGQEDDTVLFESYDERQPLLDRLALVSLPPRSCVSSPWRRAFPIFPRCRSARGTGPSYVKVGTQILFLISIFHSRKLTISTVMGRMAISSLNNKRFSAFLSM